MFFHSRKFLSHILAATIVFVGLGLSGCGGGNSVGPAGAVGATGAPGAAGNNGSNGIDGSSNSLPPEDQSGYDVVLLAGQSNMVGYNNDYNPKRDIIDPNVYQWGRFDGNDGIIIPATVGLQHADSNSYINNTVGPGVSFSTAYATSRLIDSKRKLLLVPVAFGGTGFSDKHWRPGDDLFEAAVSRANAALASNAGNRMVAILWLQGETDAINGFTKSQYSDAVTDLIYTFRARIRGASTTPFILGKFVNGPGSWAEVPAFEPGAIAVQQAISEIPMTVPYTSVADSVGLEYNSTYPDYIHFSAAAQNQMGKRFYAQLESATSNTKPLVSANIQKPFPPQALNETTGSSWIIVAPKSQPGGSVFGYHLQYRAKAEPAKPWIDDYVAANQSRTIGGLSANITYEFRATAINPAGESKALNQEIATKSISAANIPVAQVELDFDNGTLANTGNSNAIATAQGNSVDFVSDSERGIVVQLSRSKGNFLQISRSLNTSSYTKSLWVKFSSVLGAQNLISYDNPSDQSGFHYFFKPDGGSVGNGQGVAPFGNRVSDSAAPALNVWRHYVVTYDSSIANGTMVLYRDGLKISSATGIAAPGTQDAPIQRIGAFLPTASGLSLDGLIDNVRIFDSALTDLEVSDMYAVDSSIP